MRAGIRAPALKLLVVLVVQFCASCDVPVVWNADLRTFVDDGLSTIQLKDFVAENGGNSEKIIPSRSETTVTVTLRNSRSLELSCDVACEDESLFDALPVARILGPEKIEFSFTPSLKAEHKDLRFTLSFSAPSLNRTFDPVKISVHCNTPPCDVAASLDAALDGTGYAFSAFRLPSTASDDDLARVEISSARADGTGATTTVTLPVDDASLKVERRTVSGADLLGPDGPLDRYYQPSDNGDEARLKARLSELHPSPAEGGPEKETKDLK